jgi:hypothetical protein
MWVLFLLQRRAESLEVLFRSLEHARAQPSIRDAVTRRRKLKQSYLKVFFLLSGAKIYKVLLSVAALPSRGYVRKRGCDDARHVAAAKCMYMVWLRGWGDLIGGTKTKVKKNRRRFIYFSSTSATFTTVAADSTALSAIFSASFFATAFCAAAFSAAFSACSASWLEVFAASSPLYSGTSCI